VKFNEPACTRRADSIVRLGNDAEQAVMGTKNAAQASDRARDPEWSRAAF
jgi:hypothetical protein